VPPARFIPVAEETGLILPLGRWVLEQACRQLVAWRAELGDASPLSISVNVSGRQLGEPRFVDDLVDVVGRTGADPAALTIEVTETVLMDNVDQAAASLAKLQALGVRVSIDDFGTGYSSLSYLGKLPIDCLKIDRSFVAGIDRSADAATLCAAIASLARSLGLHTVAEGVETEQQRDRLVGIGCDDAQGYLFARPLPADELTSRLRAG
jgi:Amt family ammonium transporter